ncbi:zinc-dependent alcohol dehydrogenase [Meiothermus taiwanensis]|uniref:2-dehydro-3-deoxy-L-rhamnonate dehydrogenase (NAD(+)) n=1 Tax=Meiothermus taiwanensis TaxID=172827 RepID=A0A399DR90_9DEIN|nr:alcohol dehydrogenase catalytic domain-containing protein [Meiothermus taiwanensis]RIH74616.1 2-dehydro-3-deoxy-L-rhamnonate dehydrogenase (NAD(+)) [Meiothermus taiwanensis]
MQAWVLEDYGRLSLHHRETPEGAGVLLRVAACGICGSDLSVYKGAPAMRARWKPPLVLGHEIAGTVLEGPPDWLGQAVAVNPLVACGHCPACWEGLSNLCAHRTNIGFHYWGGFAEQIRVPLAQLHRLPAGVPLWKGALAEPLAVALRAVELAGPVLGRSVLVLGGGAIGTLAAWLLAEAGARVTVSERNPLRAAWLEGLGFIAEVVPTPGGLYDRVIETVGAQGTLALAVNATRPGGSVVLVGLSDLEAPLPLQRAVLQEIRIQGSYVFTQAEFARATALLAHLPDALAVRRPFAMAQASFEELLAGRLAEAKVVLLHGGYDA